MKFFTSIILRLLFVSSALFLFCRTNPAIAAFGSVATLGTGTSVTSNTTLAVTTSAQLDANNIGLCLLAFDNTSTTDGNTSEVSSIADGASNIWSKLREFTNGQGGAAAGASVSVWFTKATSTLASSGTITITFANTITSKAATCWEFTVSAGNTIRIVTGGATDVATDAGLDPPSIALSSLVSKEYLFVRAMAWEHDSSTNLTPTTNYTIFTNAVASTGVDATSQTVKGEFRILSATGDTSDPTRTIASGRDFADTYIALEEIVIRRSVMPIIFQ